MARLGEHTNPLLTLSRDCSAPTAAQMLDILRVGGSMARDEVASAGELSSATVRRVAHSLIASGVLAERMDSSREGLVGRPGARLEIASENHVVIGVDVSRGATTVALGDLTGRVIGRMSARRTADQPVDLDLLSRVAARLLGRVGHRAPIAVGLVAPWTELGLRAERAAAQMHDATGLPVRTADPVGAAAVADYFQRRHPLDGHTLYFYAGATIGWSMVSNRVSRTECFRGCSLAHFPTGSDEPCSCGRRGCLETYVGEDHVAERLYAEGLVSEPTAAAVTLASGDPAVRAALRERAVVLGRAAASIRDMLGPDRIILAGDAFVAWPDSTYDVIGELRAAEPLGSVPIEFARFGSGAAQAACTVALGPLYEDPLAVTEHLAPLPRLRAVRGA